MGCSVFLILLFAAWLLDEPALVFIGLACLVLLPDDWASRVRTSTNTLVGATPSDSRPGASGGDLTRCAACGVSFQIIDKTWDAETMPPVRYHAGCLRRTEHGSR